MDPQRGWNPYPGPLGDVFASEIVPTITLWPKVGATRYVGQGYSEHVVAHTSQVGAQRQLLYTWWQPIKQWLAIRVTHAR